MTVLMLVWRKLLASVVPILSIRAWKLVAALSLLLSGFVCAWWLRGVLAENEKNAQLIGVITWASDQIKIDAKNYEAHSNEYENIQTRYAELETRLRHIKTPNCKRLGADWVGLYVESIPQKYRLPSAAPNTLSIHGGQ